MTNEYRTQIIPVAAKAKEMHVNIVTVAKAVYTTHQCFGIRSAYPLAGSNLSDQQQPNTTSLPEPRRIRSWALFARAGHPGSFGEFGPGNQ